MDNNQIKSLIQEAASKGANEEQIRALYDRLSSTGKKEEPSFLSNLYSGLQKSTEDPTRGLAQLMLQGGASAAGALGASETEKALRGGLQSLNTQIEADRPEQERLMGTVGGNIGYLGGTAAQIAVPSAGAAKAIGTVAPKVSPILGEVLGSAAIGGIQPVEDKVSSALESGALAGVGGALSRGATNLASFAKEPLLKAAEKYGIDVGLGQVGGNVTRTLSKLADNISLFNPKEKTQSQLNSAVLRTFGEGGENITEDTVSAIKTRLGKSFDEASKYGIQDASNIRKTMASIAANTIDMTPTQRTSVNNALKSVNSLIRGNTISPKATENISKYLRKAAYEEGDATVSSAIRNISDEVESGIAASLPKDKLDDLLKAREQWKAINTIEPLVAKNQGNIPPAQLLNRLAAGYDNNISKAGDLGEIAQIASKYLKQSVPDSGTATNMALLARLAPPIAGLTGGAIGAFDPTSAGLLIGGGTGLSMAMRSPTVRKMIANSLRAVPYTQPQYVLPSLGMMEDQ